MTATNLHAGHVLLSPYTEDHDAQTVEWLNSPELQQTFGISRVVSRETHRRWMEAAKNTIVWAILIDNVGHCGNVLLHCNDRHNSAYFQIYLGDISDRGKGIGRTVLRLVLDHAFGPLNLHRVWLHTLTGNKAAEQLYRSTGFVEEGLERDALFRDGQYESQRRWSLLADDWLRRKRDNS